MNVCVGKDEKCCKFGYQKEVNSGHVQYVYYLKGEQKVYV